MQQDNSSTITVVEKFNVNAVLNDGTASSVKVAVGGVPGEHAEVVKCEVPITVLQEVGSDDVVIALAIYNMSIASLETSDTQLAAPPVRVDIYAVQNKTMRAHTSNKAFSQPIRLTVMGNPSGVEDCAWFDEESQSWSTAGIRNEHGSSPLVCLTDHLTLFGCIIRQASIAILCAQWQVIKGEHLETVGEHGEWSYSLPAILVFFVFALLHFMLLYGIVLDLRARHLGNWSVDMYCSTAKPPKRNYNVFALMAVVILGGDELADADFHGLLTNLSKTLIMKNTAFVIAEETWVLVTDVKYILLNRKEKVAAGDSVPRQIAAGDSADLRDASKVSAASKIAERDLAEEQCAADGLELESFADVPLVASIHNGCAEAFDKYYYRMTYLQQLITVWKAVHPFSTAFQQSFSMTNTVRILALFLHILLGMATMSLFYKAAGMHLHKHDPASCSEAHLVKEATIAIVSSSIIAPPVMFLRLRHKRKFHHKQDGWSPEDKKMLKRHLDIKDSLLFFFGIALTYFSTLFATSFIANAAPSTQVVFFRGIVFQWTKQYVMMPILIALFYVHATRYTLAMDLNLRTSARANYDENYQEPGLSTHKVQMSWRRASA